MTTVDDETRRAITTALNVGEKPGDIAKRFGVPVRTITALAKGRHRFREPKMPVEDGGKILHAVGVLAKWCERPEREDDAQRRDAARAELARTLAKFGLEPRDDSISIVPGVGPSLQGWHGKTTPRARRKRAALAKAKPP